MKSDSDKGHPTVAAFVEAVSTYPKYGTNQIVIEVIVKTTVSFIDRHRLFAND